MQIDNRVERTEALRLWALGHLPAVNPATPLQRGSDDASFRRYFRLPLGGGAADNNVVLVAAPPELEDGAPFVAVGGRLLNAGLRVPRQLEIDLERGFMMLEDFGDTLLLERAREAGEANLEQIYEWALRGLTQLAGVAVEGLPAYDAELLNREMELFGEWFCEQQLGLRLAAVDRAMLDAAMVHLSRAALEQPKVFVHRDYHSRNLMVVDTGPLGIIDFQDAVCGPVTYDLVSLVKDCYIRLPRDFVESFALRLRDSLAGLLPRLPGDAEFLGWMDLMGLQRHLKCAGIFSRLNLRDGKPGYLGDIPLVFSYIREVTSRTDELREFDDWLGLVVAPGVARLPGPG